MRGAGERGRVLKRPRGAGPARGGAPVTEGRIPSAAVDAEAESEKVGGVRNGESGAGGAGEKQTGLEAGTGDGAESGGAASGGDRGGGGGGDESSG